MKFDAIVIGSGQAGKPLSFALADFGWKVALIERAELGGTCVNTGCTPTKTMVASAQVAHYARDAARWGVRTSGVAVDLPAVVARKNQVVQSARTGIQKRIDARPNIKLVRGPAKFIAPHQVQVGAEVFESEKIFINSGTRPAVPRIPGLDTVPFLTNATIMELQAVPEHLLVLGGGYIGLEFGQMFRRFGSRVTIIHNGERILPREDPDIASALQKALEAHAHRVLDEGIADLRLPLRPRHARLVEAVEGVTVVDEGRDPRFRGRSRMTSTVPVITSLPPVLM